MAIYDLPGKTILLHNRCGVRIEINLQKQAILELWYSPYADDSKHYAHRNFSNRDDHMRLWDSIVLEELSEETFIRCDYDAFASTLYFENQTLQVASSWGQPIVYISASKDQAITFKSDRTDSLVEQGEDIFCVQHSERGESFRFLVTSPDAFFKYQPTIDTGRSIYCQTQLNAGKVLAIGGEVIANAQALIQAAKGLSKRDFAEIRKDDEAAITEASVRGSIQLRDWPELQGLVDTNRRVLLAMQDKQGAIRAAINRIYYLIWVRDGAIIEAFQGQAGTSEPLRKWKDFLLANPTEVTEEGLEGRTFFQMVNPISKWQEDGLFYAVWTLFQHWTQTGEQPTKEELQTLMDAVDWFERYCYNPEKNLFGRYFACETPFKGSRDHGFDGAVGRPVSWGYKKHEGKAVLRSYDVYVNVLNWNVYLMMAAMTDDADLRSQWKERAEAIKVAMTPLFEGDEPAYGYAELEDGTEVLTTGYGLDRTDYEWAISITPFMPHPNWRSYRKKIYQRTIEKPDGCFLAAYFSVMQGVDPIEVDEDSTRKATDYAAQQSYRPGDYLAMPNSVVEMLDIEDGDAHHDVRPQAFSIAPLLATLVGLGLSRLPYGLALRPNVTLTQLPHYEYRGHVLDVRFEPSAETIEINGQVLRNSWQIPESMLVKGEATVITCPAQKAALPEEVTLVRSTVRLLELIAEEKQVVYTAEAHGSAELELSGCVQSVSACTSEGEPITAEMTTSDTLTSVHFEHWGRCTVTCVY